MTTFAQWLQEEEKQAETNWQEAHKETEMERAYWYGYLSATTNALAMYNGPEHLEKEKN